MLYLLGNGTVYQVADVEINNPIPAVVPILNPPGIAFASFAVRDFASAAGMSTALFAATSNGEIYRFSGPVGARAYTKIGADNPSNPLNGMAIDEHGNLWASGNDGLFFYDARANKLSSPQGGIEANAQIAVANGRIYIGNNIVPSLDVWTIQSQVPAVVVTLAGSIASEQCAFELNDYQMSTLPPGLVPLAVTISRDGYSIGIAWSQWASLASGGYQGRAIRTRLGYDIDYFLQRRIQSLNCELIRTPGHLADQLWGIVDVGGATYLAASTYYWNASAALPNSNPGVGGIKYLQYAGNVFA